MPLTVMGLRTNDSAVVAGARTRRDVCLSADHELPALKGSTNDAPREGLTPWRRT